MKTLKYFTLIILIIAILYSVFFISKPYRLVRLESYAILALDKFGIELPYNTLFSYKLYSDEKEKIEKHKNYEQKVKKENYFDRGSIKLKDGTVLNYYEPRYKLIKKRTSSDDEFILLKKYLKEYVNLDKEKQIIKFVFDAYNLK